MGFCSHCGVKITNESIKFCTKCGQKLKFPKKNVSRVNSAQKSGKNIKFGIGLVLLICSTIFGILLLTENCGACDNATISLHKNMMVGNFAIWILGIILTIHGYQERKKIKNVEHKEKDDEIQNLKSRIEELEKEDKE